MIKKIIFSAIVTAFLSVGLFMTVEGATFDSGQLIREDLVVTDTGEEVESLQSMLIEREFLDSHEVMDGEYFYGLETSSGVHDFLAHHDISTDEKIYELGLKLSGDVRNQLNLVLLRDLTVTEEPEEEKEIVEVLKATGQYDDFLLGLDIDYLFEDNFGSLEGELDLEGKVIEDEFEMGFDHGFNIEEFDEVYSGFLEGEVVYVDDDLFLKVGEISGLSDEEVAPGLTLGVLLEGVDEFMDSYILIEKDLEEKAGEELEEELEEDLPSVTVEEIEDHLEEIMIKAWEAEVLGVKETTEEIVDGKKRTRHLVGLDANNLIDFLIEIGEEYKLEEKFEELEPGEIEEELGSVKDEELEELEEIFERVDISLLTNGEVLEGIDFKVEYEEEYGEGYLELNISIRFSEFGVDFSPVTYPVNYFEVEEVLEEIEEMMFFEPDVTIDSIEPEEEYDQDICLEC